MARPLNQLVEESEVIVHASVVSSKIEPHPQLKNLMTVLVTMKVKQTYKGKASNKLILRQYVWNAKGGSQQSIARVKT